MDDLDRLFQRLVHNIRYRNPEFLRLPFTVQDLYENLVPYRHHRRELGIETNQDYEAAVARLLSGERGYVRVDQKLQDRLRTELTSSNPDPGIFRDYESASVSLENAALEKLGVGDTPAAATQITPKVSVANSGTSTDASTGGGPAAVNPAAQPIPSMRSVEVPVGCQFCGGTLPDGRKVTFCPHCGMNLTTRHCSGCGNELDGDWKFCVNCGKKTG